MGFTDRDYLALRSGNTPNEVWALGILIAVVVAAVVWWSWYKAGVQQEVWARQGIQMSRWEVFIGADPAQKSITIKQGD